MNDTERGIVEASSTAAAAPMISRPLSSSTITQQHRVLIYATCYNVLDGVVLTIRKIEQEILAAGHHVCIVTTKSGNINNTHLDGEHPNRSVIFLDNSVPIPFLHDPNNPDASYQLGFALSASVKRKIEEFEPTLIHITTPDCTCLHLISYARAKEIPLMGTYHSNIPEYMDHYPGLGWLKHILGAFFRHQYNFIQALYCPTPFIHKHLCDTYSMDSVTNLQVWGRGIDLDRFSPVHRCNKFRQKLGFEEQDVVICWVGRLVQEKRPDIFADVVRRLHAKNIPFKALVIGAGPVEDQMKSLPNTVFAGWMGGDELATAYASCDIFLFPSAVETFGNVTLEAAASGLPLIVEQGCSGHLVKHGITGFACHEEDPDAWYDSTVCLVLDDHRRKTMSEEGRKHSLNFEKRAVCRKMLDNYSRVTEEFYVEYGGHHSNRDKVYRKDKSFVGGNHPRPVVLILVEYLFIVLFQVMYQMATMFFYVRESMFPVRASADETSPTSPTAAAVTTQPLVTKSKSVPVAATKRLIKPVLFGSDDGDSEQSEVDSSDENDLQDIPVGAILTDDTDTETTASLGDDSTESRTVRQPFCQPRDCQLSHMLSKGFVNFLLFQFRMESNLRNSVTYLCSPSEWTTVSTKRRKRKDSTDSFSDDERFEQHSGDEVMGVLLSARDERLNRRSAPLVEV